MKDLVKSCESDVTDGNVDDAAQLIKLFDPYRPEKELLVVPHLHDCVIDGTKVLDLEKIKTRPAHKVEELM